MKSIYCAVSKSDIGLPESHEFRHDSCLLGNLA